MRALQGICSRPESGRYGVIFLPVSFTVATNEASAYNAWVRTLRMTE